MATLTPDKVILTYEEYDDINSQRAELNSLRSEVKSLHLQLCARKVDEVKARMKKDRPVMEPDMMRAMLSSMRSLRDQSLHLRNSLGQFYLHSNDDLTKVTDELAHSKLNFVYWRLVHAIEGISQAIEIIECPAINSEGHT